MRTLDDLDVEGKRRPGPGGLQRPPGPGPAHHRRRADPGRAADADASCASRARGSCWPRTSAGRRAASRSSRSRPAAERLSELLGAEVELAPDLDHVPDGDVVMLENVRYEPGETKNDPELAERYAALADVYVNDAFGAAHRAHASTEAVAHLLPQRRRAGCSSARSRRCAASSTTRGGRSSRSSAAPR